MRSKATISLVGSVSTKLLTGLKYACHNIYTMSHCEIYSMKIKRSEIARPDMSIFCYHFSAQYLLLQQLNQICYHTGQLI